MSRSYGGGGWVLLQVFEEAELPDSAWLVTNEEMNDGSLASTTLKKAAW